MYMWNKTVCWSGTLVASVAGKKHKGKVQKSTGKIDLWTVSATTMPAIRQSQQKGGLGPFAQQLDMFSLAPIVTNMTSNMFISVLPGLTG